MALVALLFIFTFLDRRLAFKAGVDCQRIWARCFMWPFLMPVKVVGKHLLDKKKVYVIVCNHQSILDIPVSVIASPIPFKFLSKKENSKIPIVGYLLKHLHVLVDRSSKQSRQQSMIQMKQAIMDGYSILIFPEGSRNKGPELLKEFYEGAFRLAIETKTPLAVLTILNSWDRQNYHTKGQLFPGRITCYWEEPIETGEMTAEQLKSRVKVMMEDRLKSFYPDGFPKSI